MSTSLLLSFPLAPSLLPCIHDFRRNEIPSLPLHPLTSFFPVYFVNRVPSLRQDCYRIVCLNCASRQKSCLLTRPVFLLQMKRTRFSIPRVARNNVTCEKMLYHTLGYKALRPLTMGSRYEVYFKCQIILIIQDSITAVLGNIFLLFLIPRKHCFYKSYRRTRFKISVYDRLNFYPHTFVIQFSKYKFLKRPSFTFLFTSFLHFPQNIKNEISRRMTRGLTLLFSNVHIFFATASYYE